ncbi:MULTISPECIES: DUF3732 domain-containing protein [unclassified Mannheimia]|uniref:DUF3732 domain-containing protein n=1 Tax=unclassified Mannheimia TaxID=2645054 RepID=UPI00359D8B0A
MKTIIYEIGVLDKEGSIHKIMLKEGLNIITGKSSTGRSAIIEIFDYCFASSEYTVPSGVITEAAELYYLYIQINEEFFVLGRKANNNRRCFFSRENSYIFNKINIDYFDDRKFIDINNYKEQLNKLFMDFSDVDESIIAKEHRGKPQGKPSIRDFISFNLQHQNLIANKHAIFYRFDEKDKRDRIIYFIKIFLGFVDQRFYILSQQKEELEYNIKYIKKEKTLHEKYIVKNSPLIKYKLDIISSLMGADKLPVTQEDVLTNPDDAKFLLDEFITLEKINHNSDRISKHYQELYVELNKYNSVLRNMYIKRDSIKASLKTEISLSSHLANMDIPSEVVIGHVECPFCHSKNDSLTDSAKALNDAIEHLSDRLTLNSKLKSQLETSLEEVKNDIKNIKSKIQNITQSLELIKTQSQNISKLNNVIEALGMAKGELFFMIDNLSSWKNNPVYDEDIDKLKKKIEEINFILGKYNIEHEIKRAENRINNIMAELGNHFDFEDKYKPIKLKFSLENFNLYHESTNERIYLRTMGSGANWLYSHLTLFLALHQYFIENKNCIIPSILFLDQPTQVYFPNFKKDNYDTFNKELIKELENNQEHYDDDIKSVENLFIQLARYCKILKEKHGYSPQIIVTDHADDLELGDEFRFQDFVNNNRWRKRGFIDIGY